MSYIEHTKNLIEIAQGGVDDATRWARGWVVGIAISTTLGLLTVWLALFNPWMWLVVALFGWNAAFCERNRRQSLKWAAEWHEKAETYRAQLYARLGIN